MAAIETIAAFIARVGRNNAKPEVYDEIQTTAINDLDAKIGSPSIVDSILYRLGLIKDYVIEYGSNANGNWEKHASGKLVQWKRVSVPSQASLTWGSLNYLKIPNWTYPLPFISAPYVNGSNETLFGFFGQSKATPTLLDTPMWIMAGPFTSAVVVNLIAVGRWKV